MWICTGYCPQSRRGTAPSESPEQNVEQSKGKKDTTAWITGREAHQNDKSSANAALIYSKTQDGPKIYTHIP